MEILVTAIFAGLLAGTFVGLTSLLFKDDKATKSKLRSGMLAVSSALGVALANPIAHSPIGDKFQDLLDPKGKIKREFVRRLALSPELKARLSGLNYEQGKAIGRQASVNGLHKLSATELLAWHRIRKAMIAKSPMMCSALWTGVMDENNLFREIGELSESDREAFYANTQHAMLLGMESIDKTIANPELQKELLVTVGKSLTEAERDRYLANLRGGVDISSAESCWMIQKIFAYLDSLQSEEQIHTLRVFSSFGAQDLQPS